MNRIRPVFLSILLSAGFVAFLFLGPILWTAGREWVADLEADRNAREAQRPPPKLPIRSEDFRRYPRTGFGFVLEGAYGYKVDTFAGLVTKDLVQTPDTTIQLALTEAELDTIYRKMIEIRFFEYPEQGTVRMMKLRARTGDVVKEVSWDWGGDFGSDSANRWKRLRELIRLIRETVERRPEYQALPPPKGAYI